MINLEKIKAIALAKLKTGSTVEDLAIEYDISKSIIKDWKDSLSIDEVYKVETGAILVQKATEIVNKSANTNIDSDELKNKLMLLANMISKDMPSSLTDPVLAKSLNISADTIAKLYNCFFGGNAVSLNIDNRQISNNQLNNFRSLLKD